VGHVRGHDIHGCGWGGESERDGGWPVEALVFWDGRDSIGVGDLGVVVRSLGLGVGGEEAGGKVEEQRSLLYDSDCWGRWGIFSALGVGRSSQCSGWSWTVLAV